MSKPTVFFSHSSKDKEIVLTIKKKIDAITGGVLDIFLTSDGQSIPFGTNWVHKVEEGLNKAKIMFLFMTPNSVNSNWVNFEAGFAYSKDINVIPVGIGFDIAQLNPPISLLQGFNVTSGDGLNNFISVINDKFEYHINEAFSDKDFSVISEIGKNNTKRVDIGKVFNSAQYELLSEYEDGKGGKLKYNVIGLYKKILDYLATESIQYSIEESDSQNTILVLGIKIVYKPKRTFEGIITSRSDEPAKITFFISPNNFENSFIFFLQLVQFEMEKERLSLWFTLNSGYSYRIREEDMAAILSLHPELFGFYKNSVGFFTYAKNDIIFSIFNINNLQTREPAVFVLSIRFLTQTITYDDISSLLSTLLDINLIYQS